jgi:hypothetical protein
MPGIITAPIEAASAAAVPEMPANTIEAKMLVWPSPPRMWPTTAVAKRTMRSVMPPPFIRLPARMNAGIASMTKESMPENIFCGMIVSGRPAARM